MARHDPQHDADHRGTAATRLPGLLAAYHQRFPNVALSLVTGTSGDIIDKVRAGTLAAAWR
ncbi:hypothetical protein E05_24160 [Plautia stali symbiont]|nr:hypothetical protein E05_24160 [Plautia stali symbiont]